VDDDGDDGDPVVAAMVGSDEMRAAGRQQQQQPRDRSIDRSHCYRSLATAASTSSLVHHVSTKREREISTLSFDSD